MRDVHVCLNCGTTASVRTSRLPHEVRERAARVYALAHGVPVVELDMAADAESIYAVAEVLAEHESEVNSADIRADRDQLGAILVEAYRERNQLHDALRSMTAERNALKLELSRLQARPSDGADKWRRYRELADKYAAKRYSLYAGEVAYNAAHDVDPNLVDDLTDTRVDPFRDDSRVAVFEARLREAWGVPEGEK